ncbi:MAG: hypothetical protein WAV15_03850 [Minisyncoccia bacterium]
MIPEQFIFLGILLHSIGQLAYIISIARGHAKPNLVSWTIWAVAPMIGAFFQFRAGAGLSALPVFWAGFGPFIVILFCLYKRNAYWKLTTFDIHCGILSILALIFYFFTKNLGISLLFAMLSDALASLPTIVKAWKFPETEISLNYFLAMISNIIGLLIIKSWSFSVSAFGISLVLQSAIIIFCINRKKILFWYNEQHVKKPTQ